MPGPLLHIVAACSVFILGIIYIDRYYDKETIYSNWFLLGIVCLSFSLVPDIFLGLYYTTHILSYKLLLYYHTIFHFLLFPISVIALFVLNILLDIRKKPVWNIGFCCILLHITMDLFIP